MRRVLEQIQLAKQSTAAVFLHGEDGTGKEHIARLIHYESPARARSFVPLDCRRLSAQELAQTIGQLFEGDKVGAATVPILQPGTLYLAHVEHLPRDLQEQLAAAFLNHAERKPDLRLLASSTGDLRRAVADDTLRSDVFYLLTPIQIELPPLRRRPEDLRPLAQYFLESLNRGAERQVGGFADAVWQQFAEYNWPGNLDELSAVVSEARTACQEALIKPEHLPFRFRTGVAAQAVGPTIQPQVTPLEPLLVRIETEQIELALVQSRHNKSKAAELLSLTRTKLYRRMQALGIEDREGRGEK
jgi:DNA-binding NtrC family response regulator